MLYLSKLIIKDKEMTELKPIYDSGKSFYGKAKTYFSGSNLVLRSYSTDVAYITENNEAVVNGMYSQTTSRHIKEFLLQNGFQADNWKQIEADYCK